MTIIPIHIIEFVTLGLVLLTIYKVFKHQAIETCGPSFQRLDSEFNPTQTNQKSDIVCSSIESTFDITEETITQKHHTSPTEKSFNQFQNNLNNYQPQAALKSYIGDFF